MKKIINMFHGVMATFLSLINFIKSCNEQRLGFKKSIRLAMFYMKIKLFMTKENIYLKYVMFRHSTLPNFIDKVRGIKHSPSELLGCKATFFKMKE